MKQSKSFFHKIIIVTISIVVFGVIFFILNTKIKIVENFKQKTAVFFAYEYIPNQNLDILTREAYVNQDSILSVFRKNFKYHFQTIAYHSFKDSSNLLIISEPAPWFSLDSLKNILSKFTHRTELKLHKVGYDGYITDVVTILVNVTSENLKNIIKQINKQMFLSDYKPVAMDMSEDKKRTYFADSNINYQISLQEFNDWFLETDEAFIRLSDTAKEETLNSILHNKKCDIYFSKVPGFVAWAIPKKSDLIDYKQSIRQFALDADIILGAFSDSAMLVIIGRERETLLNVLPPLNVETVLLLASITEKELSQSLDVNDFLAGKMKQGSDWCPTYLSKELENTEFGHLLTITDILLKDWSEKGTIKEAYYRYPEPEYYPFDKPLFKKLGLNQLVYNWNTTNVMYAIDLKNITIYTLNKTGSLPISYFNSSERSVSIGYSYESRAYNYFSSLSNTDLARVVQYTALYQLFIDNDIRYSGDLHTSFPKNKPYLLLNPVKNVMNFLKQLDSKAIAFFSDTISSIWFKEYQEKDINRQISNNESQYSYKYSDEDRSKIYENVKKQSNSTLKNDFEQVSLMLKELSDNDFEQVAKYLANPRGNRVHDQQSYNIFIKSKKLNDLFFSIGKNHLHIINLDLAAIKNYYSSNLAYSRGPYLKTPSLIITYNDLLVTGGHNLNSKISRVSSMHNYKTTKLYSPSEQTLVPTSNKEPVSYSNKVPVANNKVAGNSSNKTGSSQILPASKQNIRPRETVISVAPRGNRGF